jgi:hypothetical protein
VIDFCVPFVIDSQVGEEPHEFSVAFTKNIEALRPSLSADREGLVFHGDFVTVDMSTHEQLLDMQQEIWDEFNHRFFIIGDLDLLNTR